MPSNQASSGPQYSVCSFFSGWTTWSNKFIFILKNRLLTIFEMYFFGTGKKELSCSRLMKRDILNQRTDSESQGLSYLYTVCLSLWINRFLKKIKFIFMAYIIKDNWILELFSLFSNSPWWAFKVRVKNYLYSICFWF